MYKIHAYKFIWNFKKKFVQYAQDMNYDQILCVYYDERTI